jgi:hypothetical protein
MKIAMWVLVAVMSLVGPSIALDPSAVLSAQDKTDSIIGTWALNLSKSTYVTRRPPKNQTRTFDYTRDGLVLVTLHTVNAQGNASFNHWYLALDGKEHPEFSREKAAEPILAISIKAVDPLTKELTGRRVEGGVMKVVDRFTFKVSEDRKTLSVIYQDVSGKPTGDIVVFDKQF